MDNKNIVQKIIAVNAIRQGDVVVSLALTAIQKQALRVKLDPVDLSAVNDNLGNKFEQNDEYLN